MAAPGKYPQELRDGAVRLAQESDRPLAHVGAGSGCASGGVAELGGPGRGRPRERSDQRSTVERDELRRLRAENAELRRANDILKAASAIFAAGLDVPGRGDHRRRAER
jgi:transposase